MSSAFYPQGMNSYNNRSNQNGYVSWKGSGEFNNPIAITSGNIRPLTNNDPSNDVVYKHGLPRPIKHYRRGTSMNNVNNRQVQSSTNGGNMVSQLLDTPGGYVVKSGSNQDDVCESFRGVDLISNYYPIQNVTEKPQPGQFSCDQNNKPIGNVARNAIRRVLPSSTIINKKYYTTSSEHLYNRCLTFDQNAFNFKSKVDENTYYANCSMPQPDGCNKKVVYKPNNSEFSSQGAVSSSTRLLKLQMQTIEQAKNSYKPKVEVCKKKVCYKIYS